MARDTGIDAHRQWLGYVQPSGLVVSIPALLDANARLDQNYAPNHRRFLSALPAGADGEPIPEILNFPTFAETVFEWHPEDLYGAPGAPPLPEHLEIALPDFHETLRPTYALRDFEPAGGNGANVDATRPARSEWILLVQVLARGTDFDKVATSDDRHWQATPQAKFERLLRQAHVAIGLLVNDRQIRLVYAPEKELSGHITFNLADMVTLAGRPILSALLMLLHETRLFSMGRNERLPAILENSRKYQNTVSTQLATQVVEALYELLRGFQAADDACQSELLKDVLARDPEEVYRGLLTTLLRLVFILYAEDRALLSSDPLYANHYSLAGLYERLRADDGRYHDTMDQRYGAWAQLLVLFRLIHSGARHEAMQIPAREGYLFDPERYRFLEGRVHKRDKVRIPRVSDGVIFNVLSKLRVLDGERLSYRTLAVEQIGSVYQAIMGFGLEQAKGRSIAIKPAKKHGAPATINMEELLSTSGEKRVNWFKDQTDQKLTGKSADNLKQAASMEELLMALDKAKKVAVEVTPGPVPKGAMIFQPSDERRKSGSHYTPSSLTGPIVEAALEPVLKQLGESPMPAQILNLKVCDLAMGSAAFLVEACRQLGDALMRAWHAHNEVPQIPLDEDEALFAQRLVAQRCLYGLDKNQMAADLAKLSLWLATLAKDHPFTFLDHSLRHGDALVGLTRKQIAAFNWQPAAQQTFFEEKVRSVIDRVSESRQRILNARDNTPYKQLEQTLATADDGLSIPRMIGDAGMAAFFSSEKPKEKEETRKRFAALIEADLKKHGHIPVGSEVDKAIENLRHGDKPSPPFHWELEFPEVFTTDKSGKVAGGFDVIVGNPPYGGKNTVINANRRGYLDWLQQLHAQSHGNSDLVAHFFRKGFTLLRQEGTFGLIATNTIAQGDTRSTGLRWICTNGGTVYRARRRLKWPGEAAVVVSVVHVFKGEWDQPRSLNGRIVDFISAYLLPSGGHESPHSLTANESKSFQGSIVLGMGFTFDAFDKKGVANPIRVMEQVLATSPESKELILPYVGGEEVDESPTHVPHRFVISFEDWPLRRNNLTPTWKEAKAKDKEKYLSDGIVPLDYPDKVAADFQDLLSIVELKVKPERLAQ
ncbi:MAG TPA: DNA methyltransferase, partial [Terracidiphilus sp.]|nr:DNA methyltransferase [Terracidiphilus sp.]